MSLPLVSDVICFLGIPDATLRNSCTGRTIELRVPYAARLPALHLLGVPVGLTQNIPVSCPTKEKTHKCSPCPAFLFLSSPSILVHSDRFWFGGFSRDGWTFLFFRPFISKEHVSQKSFPFFLANLLVSVFFLFWSAGNWTQGLAFAHTLALPITLYCSPEFFLMHVILTCVTYLPGTLQYLEVFLTPRMRKK